MKTEPSIGIIMGSQSDWPTLKYSANILDEFDVTYETKIVSAHRTPDRLCLLYTSPSPRDGLLSRMPSSA